MAYDLAEVVFEHLIEVPHDFHFDLKMIWVFPEFVPGHDLKIYLVSISLRTAYDHGPKLVTEFVRFLPKYFAFLHSNFVP